MASNAAFENGSRLPEPCPPKAGSWCSCHERRPHVRLTVLGNGPRRADGLGPWIPKQLERFFDVPVMRPLDRALVMCKDWLQLVEQCLLTYPVVDRRDA